MEEVWKPISGFDGYSISTFGQIRYDKYERILKLNQNHYGVVYVGLMRNRVQCHRSVPRLVANAFLPRVSDAFDTPINLDGDRWNNRVDNLAWRPRWFAVQYNRQFIHPYLYPIHDRIQDMSTGEISANSFECAKRYGLLESDVVLSIVNRTFTWPAYKQFRVLID